MASNDKSYTNRRLKVQVKFMTCIIFLNNKKFESFSMKMNKTIIKHYADVSAQNAISIKY